MNRIAEITAVPANRNEPSNLPSSFVPSQVPRRPISVRVMSKRRLPAISGFCASICLLLSVRKYRKAKIKDATMKGIFVANSALHVQIVVSTPPKVGPTATERLTIAPIRPNVRALRSTGILVRNIAMPLGKIPEGLLVHNIEFKPGKGAQMARSAGSYARIMASEDGMVTLKLPSGELRLISENCLATIGTVGNKSHENISIGKAGRARWMGRRPKVRGVAMNPVDHPDGGGEGKTSGGRHPVSPWGTPAKGYRTRKKNKASNKYIIKRRK